MTGVSRSQYARRANSSSWKRGELVMVGDKVDVAASSAKLGSPRHGRANGAGEPATLLTLAEAQRRKEVALAKLRELELEQASKKLIPAADVELGYQTLASTFRSNVLRLPSAAAGECAAVKGAPEIFAVLTKHCRGLLQRIADTEYTVEGEGDGGNGASH
jgi:hypothetical protein